MDSFGKLEPYIPSINLSFCLNFFVLNKNFTEGYGHVTIRYESSFISSKVLKPQDPVLDIALGWTLSNCRIRII